MDEQNNAIAIGELKTEVGNIKIDMNEIKAFLKDIQNNQHKQAVETASRPTWAITALFGLLCSLVGGMTMYIITSL